MKHRLYSAPFMSSESEGGVEGPAPTAASGQRAKHAEQTNRRTDEQMNHSRNVKYTVA